MVALSPDAEMLDNRSPRYQEVNSVDKWESLAERKIREALKEGVFDVLDGAGKPLNLDEDPFEDPTMRMAHRLLRQGGFSLPWIEERKDLQAAIEKVRTGLALSWKRQQTALALRAASRPDEAAWQRVLSEFRERVIELNRRITSFNLKSPSTRFHLGLLNAEGEIRICCGKCETGSVL